MYKKLIFTTLVLFCGLAVFCGLGLRAIDMHAQGLAARRSGEFIEVAQQIRLDVKRKLDNFLQTEQKRPYTDYQYYYVPADNVFQNDAMLISPLADQLDNGLAYGYFQVDDAGAVNTPHTEPGRSDINPQLRSYLLAIQNDLLPSLDGRNHLDARRVALGFKENSGLAGYGSFGRSARRPDRSDGTIAAREDVFVAPSKDEAAAKKIPLGKGVQGGRSQRYAIQTFEQESQAPEILNISRAQVEMNRANTQQGQRILQPEGGMLGMESVTPVQTTDPVQAVQQADQNRSEPAFARLRQRSQSAMNMEMPQEAQTQQRIVSQEEDKEQRDEGIKDDRQQTVSTDTVQIRIEPFSPVIIPAAGPKDAPVFGGDIYLLRHIQIEQSHLLQGFKLNQAELLAQIRESAMRLVRSGMHFDITPAENPGAVHSAILDFGFGDLVLNLFETDPGRLVAQISRLRTLYFAILAVVVLAVSLALLSLGRNLHAQLKLARKKDDFISAVSHELRTPLTSIRMYTEMLEKDWVKSEDKRQEYYASMRQETERLSRLIENVLDFSRLQRKKKKFNFTLGDINTCVEEAARMFSPCALRAGFEIKTELADLEPFAFDKDAVTQIVINLLDNAVKYAKDAADKTVTVRTFRRDKHILLEVEDHGPGIPHRLRSKVFEEFYRCADEATREATGTGLGLALVKRFAQAHKGFVSILTAKPSGVVIRIGLPLTIPS